jgi:hypothetical protein
MGEHWTRRFVQWRLRTVFVFMTLIAIGVAIWLRYIVPYTTQEAGSAAIERLQGQLVKTAAQPAWLANIVGKERYHQVVECRIEGDQVRDGAIAPVANLPFLERLYLNKTLIGDDGLRHLGRLKTLRRLALWRTQISDEGLIYLTGCSELRVLDIHQTCVTDEGLAALKHLRKLRYLKLGGPIYGPGLSSIAELPQLATLDLRFTLVGFDDLAHLAGSSIEQLHLDDRLPARVARHLVKLPYLRDFHGILTEADDETASMLARCRMLDHIAISGFGLTDKSVEELCRLPRLKVLRVHGDLTDAALACMARKRGLVEVDLQGRFSLAAVERLALHRPELHGTITTIIPDELYKSPPTYGNLRTAPLIALRKTPSELFRSIFDGEQGKRWGDLRYASVMWPAELEDLAELETFREQIVDIRLLKPSTASSANAYQRVRPIRGLHHFLKLQNLRVGRISQADMARLDEAPAMAKLQIMDSGIDDADLECFRLPASFEELIIVPSRVTELGLRRLNERYPKARMRDGHGTIQDGVRWQSPNSSQGFITSIAQQPNIDTVILARFAPPLDLNPLAELPKLKRLDISGVRDRRGEAWSLDVPLSALEELDLSRSYASDRDLEKLRFCPSLRNLYLNETYVSDNGLKHLRHTPQLRDLRLRSNRSRPPWTPSTWITGRSLHHLLACPELEVLDLSETHVRGKYLAGLSGLPKLQQIHLINTHIGNEVCEHLSRLPNLQMLSLNGTEVHDEGMKYLAACPRLKSLNLTRTTITDKGLLALCDCATLNTIVVSRTKVTKEGIAAFHEARPTVEVRK